MPSKLLEQRMKENKYRVCFRFFLFFDHESLWISRLEFRTVTSLGTIFSRWKYRRRHPVPRKSNDHLCFEMMLHYSHSTLVSRVLKWSFLRVGQWFNFDITHLRSFRSRISKSELRSRSFLKKLKGNEKQHRYDGRIRIDQWERVSLKLLPS